MLSRSDATSNYRYVYEMNGRRAAENIIIMPTSSLPEALSLCLPLPVTLASTNKRQQWQRAQYVCSLCVCVFVRTINAIVLAVLCVRMYVRLGVYVCVRVYLDISAGSCRKATADCPFSKQCTCPYYVSASPPSFSLCLPSFLHLHCTPLNEYIFVLQFGGARSSYDLPLFAFSFTQVSFGCPCYVRPLSFFLSSSPVLSRCAIISRNATRCLLRLGHSEIHIIDVCICVYVCT